MLSDEQILNAVRSEAANTIGTSDVDSELGKQRAASIDYYHGKMDDFPPLPGWSKVTMRDVFETVESIMPDLMEIFESSEDIMEFRPENEDDVEKAQQETDVVNHVFHQQNAGFLVLYTYFKDALMVKNGFVKTSWEDKETDEIEEYFDIDDEVLATLQSDDDIEITDTETITEKTGEFAPSIVVDDEGNPAQGPEVEIILTTHNVTAKRSKDASQVKVQAIPPDEVAISRNALSLQTAALVRHTPKHTTRGELLEMKIDREKVNDLVLMAGQETEEQIARDKLHQSDRHTTTDNKSMQKVDVADNYIRLDINENGKSELWHVMTGSDDTVLLSMTQIIRVPISTITPIIEPHQIFGISIADLVMDIQRIRTFLVRGALDNMAATNNQRPIISETGAAASTIDDVLTNRPGSPIMVTGDVRQALTYAPNNIIAPDLIGLTQYFDTVRVERTGIQRFGQSMDPDAIKKDMSATEFSGTRADALKAVKLIARIFAETGLKDLMINIHHTLKSHSGDRKLSLKLNGKFSDIDPRSWINRTDMQINVGLGTGTKAEQIAQLNQILERQLQAFQAQGFKDGDLVKLSQIRHTLARIVTLQGFKSPDAFFNEIDDDNRQEPEQKPDPAIVKIQSDAEIAKEKNQIEREKNQMNALITQNDNEQDRQVKIFVAVQELQLKAQELNLEFDFKTALAQAELLLKVRQIESNEIAEGTKMGVEFAERANNIGSGVNIGGDIAG